MKRSAILTNNTIIWLYSMSFFFFFFAKRIQGLVIVNKYSKNTC